MYTDKERALDICKMRMEGKTYQEIGERYHVSRQSIGQTLRRMLNKDERKNRKKCVMPNVVAWMNANRYSVKEFSELIGFSYQAVLNSLGGKNSPSLKLVKAISEKTGMTMEEVIATGIPMTASE